jgi:chain length determinant protein EpsF
MNVWQFLLTVRARWWIVVSAVAAVFCVALLLSFTAPKQYTASASIVIDVKDPIAGTAATGQLTSYMATQVEIVRSERVAMRVVKALRLDEPAEVRQRWLAATQGRGNLSSWMANQLRTKLGVLPSRDSNVIKISIVWSNAAMAATLANAFAQAYMDTNIELKVAQAKQYAAFFDAQARDLRGDLELKQKRLTEFQRDQGIVVTDERVDIETARLAGLSAQLIDIQAKRQESQSRQKQAYRDNSALPEVLQSPVISALKADLSRAEAQRQDIINRLGANHPAYQTTAVEIEGLRERIAQESARIAASFGNVAAINVQREEDIREALESQKSRVLKLREQRDAVTILQNDVVAAQRGLEAVTQRLSQTSLESQVQLTNIVQLERANEPLAPSSPRLTRNLALALLLGIMLGLGAVLGLELFDRRVRSDTELPQLLGVPLIGVVT